jgi:magnesium transporter
VTASEDRWIDLCDPSETELLAVLPPDVHEVARERLLRPAAADYEPRPRLEAHGNYVFGILAIAQYAGDDQIVFQEVGVIATLNELVTVRKTPPGHEPAYLDECRNGALRSGAAPGMCLYALVDEIAEQFIDLVDRFDDEIDELEDHVLDWESKRIRERISKLRHDILHVRRVLAPTRDAARAVLDDRVELDSAELFPRDIELRFADAYDKLLRATDGLDLSRDLLAGVRDFHQAEIANNQNEVTKQLAAIGSMLLVPTLIVGWYGQNFVHMPELRWKYGYQFSWLLIVTTTAFQFIYFRRKKWI